MGIFDFVKKKSSQQQDDDHVAEDDKKSKDQDLKQKIAGMDTSSLSLTQKMAFKMFQRMSPQKQQEMMRKAMNPQNVQKNKDKILKQIDEMVKSGQIDKGQAEAVKSQMGLR